MKKVIIISLIIVAVILAYILWKNRARLKMSNSNLPVIPVAYTPGSTGDVEFGCSKLVRLATPPAGSQWKCVGSDWLLVANAPGVVVNMDTAV